MTNAKTVFSLDASEAGQRLDRAVALRLGLGLRGARRLVERGRVLVDGQARPAGYKVRAGQSVAVDDQGLDHDGPAPHLVLLQGEFAAFFKPAGLDTQAQAGSERPSLEAMLQGLLDRPVQLVNRLDRDTSGLVLGALTTRAGLRLRALELAGAVTKRYLLLAAGALDEPLTLTQALDTAGGSRVRVLPGPDPDPLRHTVVRPLARAGDLTLAQAVIALGARHQIRAHLAFAGHPLAGDRLYGGPERASGLGLHHWAVNFEDFHARIDPDWSEIQVKLEL